MIDIKFVNTLHQMLLDSVRGSEKEPGKLRTIQNWIGPRGCTIEEAMFVPPLPEDVPLLLNNLYQYMNDSYIDPLFVNLAISHSQFETIHAYRDGNGRLGRALIPIQLAMLTEDIPILFLFGKKDIFSVPAKSQKLFDACASEDKKLVWFEVGGHSHLRINNLEKYDKEIKEFISDHEKKVL